MKPIWPYKEALSDFQITLFNKVKELCIMKVQMNIFKNVPTEMI